MRKMMRTFKAMIKESNMRICRNTSQKQVNKKKRSPLLLETFLNYLKLALAINL